MVVVVYRGQGRVCELLGFGGGGGVCGVEWVWRCCGQMLKNTRKNTHSKACAQTHICGMILCTLNIHICICICAYIHIYMHIYIYIYGCVRLTFVRKMAQLYHSIFETNEFAVLLHGT